jgi:hypothetical protein
MVAVGCRCRWERGRSCRWLLKSFSPQFLKVSANFWRAALLRARNLSIAHVTQDNRAKRSQAHWEIHEAKTSKGQSHRGSGSFGVNLQPQRRQQRIAIMAPRSYSKTYKVPRRRKLGISFLPQPFSVSRSLPAIEISCAWLFLSKGLSLLTFSSFRVCPIVSWPL